MMASDAGVLWVSSRIVSAPSELDVVGFDDWYENEHALEVLALPGVPSAIRYTALFPGGSSGDGEGEGNSDSNTNTNTNTPSFPYLITYEFPSLSYTTDPAFTAIASTPPPPPLVSRIYAHTAFDIRFYAELPTPSPPPPTSPSDAAAAADLALASIALDPLPGQDAAFALWFAKDMMAGLQAVKGFVRLRRFELASAVLRERNVVSVPPRPRFLVLVQFERAQAREQSTKREVEGWVRGGGLATAEVGWFAVKKVWSEGEVEKLVQAP